MINSHKYLRFSQETRRGAGKGRIEREGEKEQEKEGRDVVSHQKNPNFTFCNPPPSLFAFHLFPPQLNV